MFDNKLIKGLLGLVVATSILSACGEKKEAPVEAVEPEQVVSEPVAIDMESPVVNTEEETYPEETEEGETDSSETETTEEPESEEYEISSPEEVE